MDVSLKMINVRLNAKEKNENKVEEKKIMKSNDGKERRTAVMEEREKDRLKREHILYKELQH